MTFTCCHQCGQIIASYILGPNSSKSPQKKSISFESFTASKSVSTAAVELQKYEKTILDSEQTPEESQSKQIEINDKEIKSYLSKVEQYKETLNKTKGTSRTKQFEQKNVVQALRGIVKVYIIDLKELKKTKSRLRLANVIVTQEHILKLEKLRYNEKSINLDERIANFQKYQEISRDLNRLVFGEKKNQRNQSQRSEQMKVLQEILTNSELLEGAWSREITQSDSPSKRKYQLYKIKLQLLDKKKNFIGRFLLQDITELTHVLSAHGGLIAEGQYILGKDYIDIQNNFLKVPEHVTLYWSAYSNDVELESNVNTYIKKLIQEKGGLEFLQKTKQAKIKLPFFFKKEEKKKIHNFLSSLTMYESGDWFFNTSLWFNPNDTDDLWTLNKKAKKMSRYGLNEQAVYGTNRRDCNLALQDVLDLLPKTCKHHIVVMTCLEKSRWDTDLYKDIERTLKRPQKLESKQKKLKQKFDKASQRWAIDFRKYITNKARETIQTKLEFTPDLNYSSYTGDLNKNGATFTRTSNRTARLPQALITKQNFLCLEYNKETNRCFVGNNLDGEPIWDEPSENFSKMDYGPFPKVYEIEKNKVK